MGDPAKRKRVNELLQTDRQLNVVLSKIECILSKKHKSQVCESLCGLDGGNYRTGKAR